MVRPPTGILGPSQANSAGSRLGCSVPPTRLLKLDKRHRSCCASSSYPRSLPSVGVRLNPPSLDPWSSVCPRGQIPSALLLPLIIGSSEVPLPPTPLPAYTLPALLVSRYSYSLAHLLLLLFLRCTRVLTWSWSRSCGSLAAPWPAAWREALSASLLERVYRVVTDATTE